LQKKNEKRGLIQNEASESIIKNNYNGIILVAPRVGKTKILLDALRKSDFNSITVAAPFNSILDSWETEIDKWAPELRSKIILVNQRYIKKEHKSDIIVLDECHTLSENQIKRISALKFKHTLGSTGTLSMSSHNALKPLVTNIIYRYSIKQAILDRIISNYNITVVTLPLDDTEKYIEAGSKKKKFKTTEKKQYTYLTGQFNRFRIIAHKDKSKEFLKYMIAGKRMRLIYDARSKIKLTKKVIVTLPFSAFMLCVIIE